jgi:hypothetical protein
MASAVSYFVNVAAFFDEDIVGQNRSHHPPWAVEADFTSDPFSIRKATQTNDFIALTNALANTFVGSWLFDGHSGAHGIICGSETPQYLNICFGSGELASLLGNFFTWPVATNLSYNRRYFSTMITGCMALNGSWPLAVGTPAGVNQWDEPLIRKTVYIAFRGFTYAGEKMARWTTTLHARWIDGFNYDTPIFIAVNRANSDQPEVATWLPGILGFDSLPYDGSDSRW